MDECIPLGDFLDLLPPPKPIEEIVNGRPSTAPDSNNSSTTTNRIIHPTSNQSVPTFHLYSRFWRDRQVFDVIADEVLWNICVDRVHEWRGSHFDGVLRAWSCGSSTGEEVYSLSMMWEYHYKRLHRHVAPLNLQILGTDRSFKAIEASKAATYTCHSLHDLPQPLFNHYTEDISTASTASTAPTVDSTFDSTTATSATSATSATTSTSATNKKQVEHTTTTAASTFASFTNKSYFPPGTEPVGHYTRSGRKLSGGGFGGKSHKTTEARLTSNITDRCRFLHQDFTCDIPESEGPFDLILARYSVLLYSTVESGIEIIAK